MSHRSNMFNLYYIMKIYNACNDYRIRQAFGINNHVSGNFPDYLLFVFHDHVNIAKYSVFKAPTFYPLLFARKKINKVTQI